MKFSRNFTSLIAASTLAVLAAFSNVEAQAKRKPSKPFSVPCARVLQIGFDKVEAIYDKEMRRRAKGATDSGTESDAEIGALKNYLQCRRSDNARQLKSFHSDTKAEASRQQAAAKKLMRARFDGLIYGVSWDDMGADSINYAMTLRAVALLEDYAGELIYVYSQNADPEFGAEIERAERDEKTIGELLATMEARTFEDADDAANYKIKFGAFKKAINALIKENADHSPDERAVVSAFVVKLLKFGL